MVPLPRPSLRAPLRDAAPPLLGSLTADRRAGVRVGVGGEPGGRVRIGGLGGEAVRASGFCASLYPVNGEWG